jgi:hypothetical protein
MTNVEDTPRGSTFNRHERCGESQTYSRVMRSEAN